MRITQEIDICDEEFKVEQPDYDPDKYQHTTHHLVIENLANHDYGFKLVLQMNRETFEALRAAVNAIKD